RPVELSAGKRDLALKEDPGATAVQPHARDFLQHPGRGVSQDEFFHHRQIRLPTGVAGRIRETRMNAKWYAGGGDGRSLLDRYEIADDRVPLRGRDIID